MDLGFGNSNQRVGSAAAQMMLQTAQAQEKALENELAAYDALLDDDDALEILRAKRLAQLKQDQEKRQQWKAAGHGEYTELAGSDTAKAFFEAAKASDTLVVHFYRPTTELCTVFHAHLAKLAAKHWESRFLKINVEGCDHGSGGAASYLVDKLGIVIMPTILVVKDRKVVHHIRGCDELGGSPEFSTPVLEYVLGVHGGVRLPEDAAIPAELQEQQQGVNAIRIRGSSRKMTSGNKSSVRDGVTSGRYNEEDYY